MFSLSEVARPYRTIKLLQVQPYLMECIMRLPITEISRKPM
nr:MAG TPA: hypothetical protein [Caudoviricetes sp.]DAP11037.1 MAG TPA: hypothetical protein [Caudoviricetes sp.]